MRKYNPKNMRYGKERAKFIPHRGGVADILSPCNVLSVNTAPNTPII